MEYLGCGDPYFGEVKFLWGSGVLLQEGLLFKLLLGVVVGLFGTTKRGLLGGWPGDGDSALVFQGELVGYATTLLAFRSRSPQLLNLFTGSTSVPSDVGFSVSGGEGGGEELSTQLDCSLPS